MRREHRAMGGQLRNRMRATTHRVLEVARAARSRADQGRERLEQGYRRLLSTVGSTVRHAERVCAELVSGTGAALSKHTLVVTRSQAQLEHFVPLVRRVMAQTRARIFQNDTHYPDKLFSLFEPHTEAIRKGKPPSPPNLASCSKSRKRRIRSWSIMRCMISSRRIGHW
jgi:IS5 family transposase